MGTRNNIQTDSHALRTCCATAEPSLCVLNVLGSVDTRRDTHTQTKNKKATKIMRTYARNFLATIKALPTLRHRREKGGRGGGRGLSYPNSRPSSIHPISSLSFSLVLHACALSAMQRRGKRRPTRKKRSVPVCSLLSQGLHA